MDLLVLLTYCNFTSETVLIIPELCRITSTGKLHLRQSMPWIELKKQHQPTGNHYLVGGNQPEPLKQLGPRMPHCWWLHFLSWMYKLPAPVVADRSSLISSHVSNSKESPINRMAFQDHWCSLSASRKLRTFDIASGRLWALTFSAKPAATSQRSLSSSCFRMKRVAKSQLGSFCPGSLSFRNPVSVTQAPSGRLRALLYTWRNWNALPTD